MTIEMNKMPPNYLQGNVDAWQQRAEKFASWAGESWATDCPGWGVWRIPESDIRLLPADMSEMNCIELGCGTAYVSAWMCRRGAHVVAIDPTPAQLETARRLQEEHQLDLVIEQGFAESVPYPDASFDFAISEYGAALWADPYLWIPEAARILKPGGQLVFLTNSPLWVMCVPDNESDGPTRAELLRPYFGMHKTTYPDAPGETEFHLTHGNWISLLRANCFSVERLVELQAPSGSTTDQASFDPEWAAQWPSEEAWVVKKMQLR
jgi:SAM-dependent methyltransferase